MKYIKEEKIKKMEINSSNVSLVLDFDATITKAGCGDSWGAIALPEVMGKEMGEKMNQLYEIYHPIELDYTLDDKKKEEMIIKWYLDVLALYYQYDLTIDKLAKSLKKSKLAFREGAKGFLQKAARLNIPVIILSAGIGNTIEKFLLDNNCYYNNTYIISNFLEFDETGHVKKFDHSQLIHSMNKTMQGNLPKQLEEKLAKKKYKILMGDLTDDEKMVPENQWDTTVKIGLVNYDSSEHFEMYQKYFDIVLSGKDANFNILQYFFN